MCVSSITPLKTLSVKFYNLSDRKSYWTDWCRLGMNIEGMMREYWGNYGGILRGWWWNIEGMMREYWEWWGNDYGILREWWRNDEGILRIIREYWGDFNFESFFYVEVWRSNKARKRGRVWVHSMLTSHYLLPEIILCNQQFLVNHLQTRPDVFLVNASEKIGRYMLLKILLKINQLIKFF